jgi:hypothetical protein
MSKRSTVTGLTAGIAVAPALAASSADDGELIQLGAELFALRPKYDRLLAIVNLLDEQAWKIAEQRAGVYPPGDGLKGVSRQDGDTFLKAMFAARTELGCDKSNKALQEVSAPVDKIIQRMNELPARSVAGLASKAIAAVWNQEKLWQEPAVDLDMGPCEIRHLIDSIFALAGMVNPILAAGHQEDRRK